MKLRAKHLLVLWLIGFLASLTIQSVFQGWFAEVTAWGGNVGWQTEIAIWNAGLALVLVCLLRQPEAAQAAAIPGLTLLSIAFDHLQAGILQPDRIGHWMGASANFTGVFLSAFYYIAARRSSSSEPEA
ncbi:MAG: hypothetical protein GXP26_14310 [Planctomycetes bacterium]|nr:hypothetical protein [Planctomycetota bacterium]